MSLLHHIRSLHSLAPANKDHVSAWRVAISVAVPTLALLVAGRPELIGYAVFGALTGMYGRTEPHQLRLRHQGQAAILLLAGVGVGVFLSVHHIHSWALVITEAAFAGVGSLFTDRTALKPAGPFFGILALGACASVPAAVPWQTAVLIAAGSAAFSIMVGFGGWFRGRTWQRGFRRNVTVLRGAGRRAAWLHAARYVSAVGAAGTIGVLSGSGHPHWAMAAAAVPLAGADLPSSVYRGVHRIVGTLLGLVVVAAILFPWPGSPPLAFPGHEAAVLACLVIVLQFSTELFMARHYGLAMVSFTPVILLIGQLAAPADPRVLVTERALETLVGAAVGILVVLLTRRRSPAIP
ncbi:Fusaric acid resistance protein-like [Arthrobacter sp. ov407]|uniref:FUSC family protein n=1 Tax=Arthrobacter sp. ov407 TaxID=1761748 RepID=UPI00088168AD|nr:FUSC family protein [Arthrobacter sp. ov407]SDL01820.1 Fusaric acid resistance protein-like [Arthrobacter sp. ov407]